MAVFGQFGQLPMALVASGRGAGRGPALGGASEGACPARGPRAGLDVIQSAEDASPAGARNKSTLEQPTRTAPAALTAASPPPNRPKPPRKRPKPPQTAPNPPAVFPGSGPPLRTPFWTPTATPGSTPTPWRRGSASARWGGRWLGGCCLWLAFALEGGLATRQPRGAFKLLQAFDSAAGLATCPTPETTQNLPSTPPPNLPKTSQS